MIQTLILPLLIALVSAWAAFGIYMYIPKLKYMHIDGPKQSLFLGNMHQFVSKALKQNN